MWKSFFAMTTLFFFCATYVIGCATTTRTETGFKEVRRESGKTMEYFAAPDGRQIDVKIVEEALRQNDIKTLESISSVYRPASKETVAAEPEKYGAGEVSLYQDYQGGEKYINVGSNPQNMQIPPGWLQMGLPKNVLMTVGGGKDGRKRTTGVLKKGEVVWGYAVVENGKPRIDPQKGILLQLGAVKQCGNQIYTDIKIWYPLPLFRETLKKHTETILVLQKVIDRGQATAYLQNEIVEKEKPNYWVIIPLAILAAAGAYLIGKSQAGETVRTVERPATPPNGPAPRPPVPPAAPAPPPSVPPPNTPVAGEPCPVVPYIGSNGQIVQPAPAPRPSVP
jgi:hypothetical protein